MVRHLPILFMLLAAFQTVPRAGAQEAKIFLAMPATLVPLDSPEGKRLFRESTANDTFWPLSQFYITQPDPGSCSVASSVMALNVLAIERPVSKQHGEYRLFTPENFFSPAVEAIRPRAKVSAGGMTLDQLAQVLSTWPVEAVAHHATPGTLAEFRVTLRDALRRTDRCILVNYLRKAVGQQTGGHISPLGAYNEAEDMVLILDVSNYKYPWTWVKVDPLWSAMEAVDEDSGQPRGFVTVTPRPKA